MELSGLISASQADRLRAGLAAHSSSAASPTQTIERHRIPVAVVAAVFVLVLVFFILSPGGSPEGVQDVASTLNEPGLSEILFLVI
jgi:hypothetical protein